MSLDVYLHGETPQPVSRAPRIFIREDGARQEIAREAWEARYPGREPVSCVADETDTTKVYWANITHNLGVMATAAGLYGALWRPEEAGITYASELIAPLRAGLAALKAAPATFTPFNPTNGWGHYDQFVCFVAAYLEACERYPEAKVSVSR